MVGGAEGGEILLLTFRQVGCVLPEDITLLEQIGPSHLVELVARSLWLITDGDAIFDANLPSGMASRHRLCTNLANAVKKLGYTGECGYSQLLYPVGSTTRDILGFLVERLPREEEETQTEMIGPNALLNRRILFSISTWTTVRLRVLLLHLLHPLLPLFLELSTQYTPRELPDQESCVQACCPTFNPGTTDSTDSATEARFKSNTFATFPLVVPSSLKQEDFVASITAQIPVRPVYAGL